MPNQRSCKILSALPVPSLSSEIRLALAIRPVCASTAFFWNTSVSSDSSSPSEWLECSGPSHSSSDCGAGKKAGERPDGERRSWKDSVIGVDDGVGGRLRIVLAWIGRMKGDAAVGGDSGGGEGCSRVLFFRGARPGRRGTSTGSDDEECGTGLGADVGGDDGRGADAEGCSEGLGAEVGGNGDDLGPGNEKLKGNAFGFESDVVVSAAGVEGWSSEELFRTGTGRCGGVFGGVSSAEVTA